VVGTSLAVSAGLLVAGALALIVVRRRNAKN
jgi:LPXTG-motif cell wall-anchored protein